jgi:hypothetical protein
MTGGGCSRTILPLLEAFALVVGKRIDAVLGCRRSASIEACASERFTQLAGGGGAACAACAAQPAFFCSMP